ncbi:hypothetical protein BDN71DRAFT_1399839 [Pleurotus eryngii]|uniref:Uncharacterized protein n=1 Tax=Pleurotus eryngii TaxID=5323 RepID=A0A9P6DCB3_PLEER|nr:hypothetical protein BDN71DRAFT_1399839 [Pleurotus eryngii]
MPVPVPLNNKPVAHPVAKNFNPRSASHPYTSDLQHLARSLPVSPAGPPPSFGTREQWINSLPSWRRSKPRRIWEEDTHTVPGHRQYFHQGLTAVEDAVVIKGKRAQACIPPLGTLLRSLGVPSQPKAKMPALTFGTMNDYDQYSMSVDAEDSSGTVRGTSDCAGSTRSGSYGGSPMLRDESPTGTDNDGSSPLGPVTPFSDFIDRAVSTPAVPYGQDDRSMGRVIQDPYYATVDYIPGGALPPPFRPSVEYVKEQAPAPVAAPEVVTPSASPGYRKLAEPLANWVVNYVWRVCTTGFSLPPKFAVPSGASPAQHPLTPPAHLTGAVHSLLLSTLLQPSAVFLAIWYIVHLPVYFDAVGLDTDGSRESVFRRVLLMDPSSGVSVESQQAGVPFRLIVLGCMLANKWLDDHTFSNKTWHTISDVPIGTLNKLESMALAIFSYDLSVPSEEWNRWLSHVLSYHCSLSSPSHPQPISRPSTNPHSIVRKAMEEILASSPAPPSDMPQPTFLGLDARRKEKQERELVREIDLDEDGPLREEYLPKRRSTRSDIAQYEPTHYEQRMCVDPSNLVPSPAKWSPSSGEPIFRERNAVNGHYVAVQPSFVPVQPLYQTHHYPYAGQWNAHLGIKSAGYPFEAFPTTGLPQNTLHAFPYVSAPAHSRSLSVSHGQDPLRGHLRSYSQTHVDHRWSQVRMTANDSVLPRDLPWVATHGPYYPPQALAPHPPSQSAWVRS